MEATTKALKIPPHQKPDEQKSKEGGGNSLFGVSSARNAVGNTNSSILRRRPSLYDKLDRSSRQTSDVDPSSSFSFASFGHKSSKLRAKSRTESKKRSISSLDSNSSKSDESSTIISTSVRPASRSLFGGSLMATTVCETQHDHATPVGGNTVGRTSLFGSVMHAVGQRSGDAPSHNNCHRKSPNKANIQATTPTATRRRKWSAFTPEPRGRGGAVLPFGSPGGFQMLDLVNTVASPFHKSNSNHSHSNLSAKSPTSDSSNEWQNTSMKQGIMDWSLPYSIKFDCFPARIVSSVLKRSPDTKSLGIVKFLQAQQIAATAAQESNVTNTIKDSLVEWESGLHYWQHPAVHPSPYLLDAPMKNDCSTKGSVHAATMKRDEDPFQKPMAHKKRRASLNLSEAKPLAEVSNVFASNSFSSSNQMASLQRQHRNYTLHRQLEWKQSFASLYWKWISNMRQLKTGKCDDVLLESTYFYSCGEDHVVLFQGMKESEQIKPIILMSSSSTVFRNKLRKLGVKSLCLMEAWNGHSKGTVFVEDMIKQNKGQGKSNTKEASDKAKASSKGGTDSRKDSAAMSLQSPTKEIGNGSLHLQSPSGESNSPFVKEELAALRRAQVFGETVGADVTITMKRKTAEGPKISLASVPPLTVTGYDDCSAFMEAYMNMGSSCCAPPAEIAKKKATDGDGKAFLARTQDWQPPRDVPLLLCRGLGPFDNATIKSLMVRRTHQYGSSEPDSPEKQPENNDCATVEVLGGPVLPCAIKQLFYGLAETMKSDKRYNPSEESDSDSDEDEETLIGSHNLILRCAPQAGDSEADDHSVEDPQSRKKHGFIGSSRAQNLNKFHTNGGGKQRQVLGMVVWDILHPHAMAYKLESALSEL